MEIWKRVKGYNEYEVSNLGRVKSFKKNGERLLRLNIDKQGYFFVRLYKDKKPKHFFVHRLVANEFIDNPYNKPQINHKDGNKSNNNLENLEWVTNGENQIHAYEIGLKESPMKGKFGKEHKQSMAVIQFLGGGEILEYEGIKEAYRSTGIPDSNISLCCRNLKSHAGGFKWMYKSDYELLSSFEKENSNYKIDKFLTQSILQFDKSNNLIKEFKSANEAEKITDIHKQNILECCKGKRKTAGGYVWIFKKEYENDYNAHCCIRHE